MQKQKRKTNHIHRAACALLAGLALSLGLLTGCGSDGSTIVVGKKNEKGYSRAEVMVIAMTEKKRYEEVCTDQIWGVSVGEKGDDFETYLKKQIRSFMDELKIMNLLAADRGISLTSEERAAMDRAAAEYFGRLPQSAIDSMGVTEADVQHIYEDYGLAEKLAGTDQLMARAGQMVSSFVGYPAYTVADHKTAATVRRFELIPVDANSFIAVVMLSDSQVKSQLLPLQLPVADGGLPDMSHLLNTHFTGIGPEDMNGRLMSLSEQVPGQWFLPLNRVVEYAGRLLKEANSQEVFPSGAKEFLRFPEYRDADKAHDLMTFMVDNKEQLPAPTEGGPVQILIGPENLSEALRDSSVVVASYDIGDNMRGLVGVVGPTRMDYATVAARLSYFAESLSRMFGKKQLPEDIQ